MRSTLAVTAVLMLGSFAAAQNATPRPVAPLIEWTTDDLANFDANWVHVKFTEGMSIDIAAEAQGLIDARGADLDAVNDLLADARTVRRTFEGDPAKFRAWKAKGEAASGRPGPNLALWFDVQIDGGRAELATLINALNALDAIEIAHPAPICEPASIRSVPSLLARTMTAVPGGTPDFSSMQDYLYDTPVGLDAPAAWAHTGGRGLNTKFIDVELGWAHAHEDFNTLTQFHQGGGNDPSYENHGTAVLGEVIGRPNGYGVTGFADECQWGTVGIPIGDWPVVPSDFLEAAEALSPGDVWLIELQMYPPGAQATPMEWVQVNYDVIWTSSWSLDVVCVEAGANGSQNLDAASWGGVFDRNVRDSGAIMVGAGTPTGRVAEWFTNYGSRMDAHAWGSQIVTTGYGDLYDEGPDETEYTADFGGTSGASPMVVGASLCLQGISRDENGSAMTPPVLRQLLTDTGIANLGGNYIGPRPDLGAAIDALLADDCDADLDGSGSVDVTDLLAMLAAWGTPAGDVTGDGNTTIADLLALLSAWGPC